MTFAEHEQAKAAVASGFCTLGADQPDLRGRLRVAAAAAARAGHRGPMMPPRGPGFGYGPPQATVRPPQGYGYGPPRAARYGYPPPQQLRAARPEVAPSAPAGARSCRRPSAGPRMVMAVRACRSAVWAGRPAALSPYLAGRARAAAVAAVTSQQQAPPPQGQYGGPPRYDLRSMAVRLPQLRRAPSSQPS